MHGTSERKLFLALTCLALAFAVTPGCSTDDNAVAERRGLPALDGTRPEGVGVAGEGNAPRRRTGRADQVVRPIDPATQAAFESRRGATPDSREAQPAGASSGGGAANALRRAVGMPSSCLGSVSDDVETLRVGINAYVDSASGRITRVAVAAPDLDQEGRDCVERHVLSKRLSPGLVDPSRTVGITLEIRQRPAQVAEMQAPPPPPPNGGLPAGARPIQSREGVAIRSPAPQMITATMGRDIDAVMGTAIQSRMGVGIMGPSGTAIRQ